MSMFVLSVCLFVCVCVCAYVCVCIIINNKTRY